jgi:radical SAM-linked protein
MPADKFRFRFSKTGFLRLLSHHDLMRCLERMLRRADLPIKTTAGFRPGPRIVYPLPLSLGIIGWNEVVEMEFLRHLDPEEVLKALNAQAPEGLRFLSVQPIPPHTTARVRRVEYRLPVPGDRLAPLRPVLDNLLRQEHIWVPRLRPTPKYLNIRPYLRRLSLENAPQPPHGASLLPFSSAGRWDGRDAVLCMDVWVTPDGTARAEEIVRSLQLENLLEEGAILERTLVELHDEMTTTDPQDQPPNGPADCRPLEPETLAAMLQAERCKSRFGMPEQRREEAVVE